jgi:hypothetical protein
MTVASQQARLTVEATTEGGNQLTSDAFHADYRPSDRPEAAKGAWKRGIS